MYSPNDKIWFVSDFGRIYGPLSLNELKNLVAERRISQFALVSQRGWIQWVSILSVYNPQYEAQLQRESEINALVPTKWEAVLYLLVILFFLSLAGACYSILFLVVAIILTAAQIAIMVKIYRSTPKTVTGTIGNIVFYIIFAVEILMIILIIYTFVPR